MSNKLVSTTIVGMRSVDHVRANIALSDGAGLDPDLLQALRKHRLGQRGSFLEQLSAPSCKSAVWQLGI